VSFQTDFYSLGILALELLYGNPPFGYCLSGDNIEKYLNAIINKSDMKI
jgi:serine/threonine protein kinase